MSAVALPAWLEPMTLPGWPVQPVESAALHVNLRLRAGWEGTPHVTETPTTVEGVFRGASAAELCTVAYMPTADLKANLRDWVEATVAIAGFPIPERMGGDEPPELVEWQYLGRCNPLEVRLGVDETHLYEGLGWLDADPPELARLYVLLARRGQAAWKIALSFLSACPPGAPEDRVYRNDHVRAGATLGYLELL